TDENPYRGKNLYRLKMMDFDGHFTYSDVITINFSASNPSLKLYPNPTKSILNLKITSEKSEIIKLKITDALGKVVYQKILEVNAGENIRSVNVRRLPAGTYYLNINQNNTSEKIGFVKE
ncbi:MAG TPA: T9SS type A sorting domain-containing protein, partial [Hanamia sp.]|nr:T9SS type A sorting domain-containing protein [Hanamia sp.]